MRMTHDDGVDHIVAGYANSDYWLIKINGDGEKVWDFVYGGTKDEKARKIIRTTDGKYILSGISYSSDGDKSVPFESRINQDQSLKNYYDEWFIKIETSGSIVWERTFLAPEHSTVERNLGPLDLIPTKEKGFLYVATNTSWSKYQRGAPLIGGERVLSDNNGSIYVVSFDENASIDWQLNFGSVDGMRTYLGTWGDDGFVFAGNNTGENQLLVSKILFNGTHAWEKAYDFPKIGRTPTLPEISKTKDQKLLLSGDEINRINANGDLEPF